MNGRFRRRTLGRSTPRTAGGCGRCSATRAGAAGSRPSQQEAWDAHHRATGWFPTRPSTTRVQLAGVFGRSAPLIVEIGSGVGEATAVLAAAASVVRRRGGGGVAARGRAHPGLLAEAGAENVRLLSRGRGLVPGEPVRAGRGGGALDVLPRPVAQAAAPQAAAGHAGVRGARGLRLRPDGDVAAGHGLGGVRRADARRCSTPSRC